MKKNMFVVAFACLSFFFFSCLDTPTGPVGDTGTIFGHVHDFRGGTPVRDANVQLRPTGQTAATGADGRFQFSNVKAGTYSITVTKSGYTDLVDPHNITVRANHSSQRDVMILRQALPLRLVAADGTTNDISWLNFSSAEDTRSFSIFNENPYALEWTISNNTEWIITDLSSGTVSANGGQQPIVVTIDHSKLPENAAVATITIRSESLGSRDLTVSLQSAPPVLLSLNAVPAIGGTVTPASPQSVAPGMHVPISAAAGSEYNFVNWTVTSGQAQITNENNFATTVILNSDAIINAVFRKKSDETPTGTSLAAQLHALHINAKSDAEYTIILTGNENIGAQPLSFTDRNNITVRIIGSGGERVVQLTDNGSLFEIGASVTLALGNNITLRGHSRNNSSLVSIAGRGTLIMESGAKISGNTNTGWNGVSGVYVGMDGHFFMKSGEISGMGGSYSYGGVYVADGGYFEMSGGKITNNRASNVGGVGVGNGIFMMTGGVISDNTSTGGGGGVRMWNGIFEMEGGSIFDNIADGSNRGGGGVYVANATFNMTGGEIYGNSADMGGGVYVENSARIYKTGGTINGHSPLDPKRNTARAGRTSNDRGHAVYVASSPIKRRETTAGSEINLNSDMAGASGGWE